MVMQGCWDFDVVNHSSNHMRKNSEGTLWPSFHYVEVYAKKAELQTFTFFDFLTPIGILNGLPTLEEHPFDLLLICLCLYFYGTNHI